MTTKESELLGLIKSALWGEIDATVNQDTYEEMRRHALLLLPAGILTNLSLPSNLRESWKKTVIQQIAYHMNYRYVQSTIPITVPYVILKGTSAAQYYPHPEYRTMGDIDIMTRREDFEVAYQQLISDGYKPVKDTNREIGLIKNGIVIELHRYFASLNSVAAAQYLDDLIINNITSSHVLPDLINGLVLLEHISQHLEHGLGFRQIIDWMMFVHKCLSDENWREFQKPAEKIGLKELAIVVTHMCEMFLGLPAHQWCANADNDLCIQFFKYIFSCGNFGEKKKDDSAICENIFTYTRNPITTFILLQKRGLVNWNLAKKCFFLRPFAWIYQSLRYGRRGLFRENAVSKLKNEYNEARKRRAMFDALGVKQTSKGVVVYKGGKYKKS